MTFGIPSFSVIPLPYKVCAAVLGVGLVFGGGYITGLNEGNKRVVACEVRAANLVNQIATNAVREELRVQEAANHVTTRTVTQYVDRVRTIHDTRTIYVQQAANTVPSRGNLSNGWISVYDSSITGNTVANTVASDATDSGISDVSALAVIVRNNGSCAETREQLISLQNWVRDTRSAIEGTSNHGN